MVGFVVGLVVVIVIRVRRHDVPLAARGLRRHRRHGALASAPQLNEFPLQEFDYPTTDSYGSFLSRQLLQAHLAALGAGGLLFILTAGAEPLYREAFGDQISLGNLFRPRGLRTKRFFLGSILGITLTGIFIAYQTAFYIVAYRFGAWSPADVPYSDLLNTRFPWAFVLFGGFFPAVSEEFLFRMFAIPFLRKAACAGSRPPWCSPASSGASDTPAIRSSPSTSAAWKSASAAWRSASSCCAGASCRRWSGTTRWTPCTAPCCCMRSPSLYFKLSGAAAAGIIVLPVFVALVAYWRNGGFESVTGLLNADEEKPADGFPAPEAGHGSGSRRSAHPLAARTRIAAVVALRPRAC